MTNNQKIILFALLILCGTALIINGNAEFNTVFAPLYSIIMGLLGLSINPNDRIE